ncbi:MAG: DUF4394 domain-containing protein [Chroococcus sp. CMT-3BRIN-NPC107]|nr:DUF4394 domain-containing protein [Chroococcus sp. CMT-3BRIN-NPC107]
MNNRRLLTIALATVASSIAIAPQVQAVGLTGLTRDNTLVNFDSQSPDDASFVQVTGVTGNLLGIDYRPADGQLYGLASDNNIYMIDSSTGAATLTSTLSVTVGVGVRSGIDFNPVVDRLRVVGSNDTNYRSNVDTGATLVDGNLAYGTGDANFGVNPNITAAAYANSFLGAPSPTGVTPPTRTTALYGIDSTLDVLTLQSPPNDGTLTTIGSLGIDFSSTGGFDIFSAESGTNIAFAATDSELYTIDLGTGAASLLGEIGGSRSLIGLAAEPVPEPSSVIGSVAAVTLGGVVLMRRRRRSAQFSK